MAYIVYILCSLLFLSSEVLCMDNITDFQAQLENTEPKIASTLIRMGKRTKNPLIQLLGQSFNSLENKFDEVDGLIEDANLEKQMEETDRIEKTLESAINETEHRLEKMIAVKFATLADEICRMHVCSEWSKWSDCDSKEYLEYGVRTRTRGCGKRASFCSEASEPKFETENAVCKSLCPIGYTLVSSKYCVKLYTSVTHTWEKAEGQCQNDGGHLINIDSASKTNDVTEILNKENPGNVWIGGIKRSRYGEWEFSDGSTSLEYTNWNYGNPNRYRYPSCMYLLPSQWYWEDNSCDYSYNFMCEFTVP